MRVFLLLFSFFSILFANNIHSSMGNVAIMVMIFVFVFFLVISLLFISSQNKLIDTLQQYTTSENISKVWTYTQLIPLWAVVAFIVSVVKIDNKVYEFNIKYELKEYTFFTRYNTFIAWGWVFCMIASYIIHIFSFFSFIFFVMYWINIVKFRENIENSMSVKDENLLEIL